MSIKSALLIVALLMVPIAWGQSNVSGGGQGVTTVTASAPLASSGGATPNISIVSAGPITITPSQVLTTYGAKFDGTYVADATTTSGSNIVTCPNSDCKFQTGTFPAKAGQIFFANDSTSGAGGINTCLDNPAINFGGNPQTTILSVDSDTQIHVTGNSDTTSTALACAVWGDDDTTALNNAYLAGGCTGSLTLPAGIALVQAPMFQAIAGCPLGPSQYMTRIWGSNVQGTYLAPTPNFNFTSVAGSGGPTCTSNVCKAAFFNPATTDIEDLSVWGFGTRCSTNANTSLIDVGTSTRFINSNGYGWCGRGGGATLIGINVHGGTDIFTWGGATYFGSTAINFNQQLIYFGNSFITANSSAITGACAITTQTNSSVTSVGNGIIGCVTHAGTWTSQNSTYYGNDINIACITLASNSVLNLLGNDTVCLTPKANESAITYSGTGGVVRASYSSLTANGTGDSVKGVAGNLFVDVQANNLYNGGAATWNGLGTWSGSGSAAGTTQTAANWSVPAGSSAGQWGTTPSVACPGTLFANTGDASAGDAHMQACTITVGSGTVGANPVLTVTIPTSATSAGFFGNIPICTANMVAGTATLAFFKIGVNTFNTVVATYQGTPGASTTIGLVVTCGP